ncbi:MAG: hypothetical protein JOZ15_10730, partial [Acidobacteria bacterium]|nr:hypothetical protein [Acidobacteriota bacterium]
MPLIPNDDPEALAELLGYLGEIGYGELYLRRTPEEAGHGAAPAGSGGGGAGGGGAGGGDGRIGVAPAIAGEASGEEAARVVGELAAAARQAAGDAGAGVGGPDARARRDEAFGTADQPAQEAHAAGTDQDDPAARAAALAAAAAAVAACRR